jgi:ADP-heptose:LPS heptosyltransferase
MPNRIVALVGSRSLGDTLCSIPTIKHLHNIYNKNIHVFTYQKELLKNYPYITLVDDYNINNDDILIETFRPDIFTHTRVDIRQIHALSSGFQLLPNEMEIKFYPDKYKNINKLPMNYVVIHPSKSWPSRSWEKERWQNLINKLNEKNIPIVAIGKDSEESGTYNIKKPIYKLDIKNGLNLINKLNIHQTWHVLNKSQLVITMDSGILHFAGTTDTHIIQLGSSISPFLRAPYRKGLQSYKYSYITGECGIFCSSDMKYNIKHNNDHKKMPPVAFCLERPESIGKDEDPDPNIYKCHPNVDKVFREIIKHYNFPNKGKIKL